MLPLVPAVGLLAAGLEWRARVEEAQGGLIIPFDAPALKYEMSPGGRHNSHGFNEREVPVEKPAGLLRIAALGDSVTNGALVAPEQAWPRQLEGMLQAKGFPGQVLNFGVFGYDAESVAAQFTARVVDWQPDLAIYGFYVNDPMPTEMVSVGGHPIWVGTGARPFRVLAPSIDSLLHRASAEFRRVEGAAAARALAARTGPAPSDWPAVKRALASIAETSRRFDVPVLVLLIPPHVVSAEDLAACDRSASSGPGFCEENLDILERAEAICRDEHLPSVNGVLAYRADGVADLHMAAGDPHHPNAEGHRRLAAALAPNVLVALAGSTGGEP